MMKHEMTHPSKRPMKGASRSKPIPKFFGKAIAISAGGVWLAFATCSHSASVPSGSSNDAPAKASAIPLSDMGAKDAVSGRWARSVQECARPEFVIAGNTVVIQTDADGEPIEFTYTKVTYSKNIQSLISIELGSTTPYADTPSKTALTFKWVSSNEIDMIQSDQRVAFVRCK